MDDHFWIDIRLFPHADDGAEHVPYCGKIEEADGKILWNQVDCAARFRRSFLFYFRGNHVFGEENPGKTGLAGKTCLPEGRLKQRKLNLRCLNCIVGFIPD